MTAPQDFSRASWRLKIERAKKHFVELQEQTRIYSESHPYRVRWERKKHKKSGKWRCLFELTEKPPAEFAIIVGDVVHNVRSALDHIGVAVSGNKRGGFPICTADPLTTDADKETRASYERCTSGMSDKAIAIVQRLQPYAAWPVGPTCPTRLRFWHGVDGQARVYMDRPETHYLTVLSRLDNADKHRALVTIATGMIEGMTIIMAGGGDFRWKRFASGVLNDRAEIATSPIDPQKHDPKMQVHITGTVQIGVRLGSPEGYAPITNVLDAFTDELPDTVFGALEPFVK